MWRFLVVFLSDRLMVMLASQNTLGSVPLSDFWRILRRVGVGYLLAVW